MAPEDESRNDVSKILSFEWEFRDPDEGDSQTAYQIQVDDDQNFSTPEIDSGKTVSTQEKVNMTLPDSGLHHWRVRTWDSMDVESPWSLDRSVIADRQALTLLECNNTNPPVNGTVLIWALSSSEYDGHNLTSGDDLRLEGHDFAYNGSYWIKELCYNYSYTFTLDSGECNEITYSVTSLKVPNPLTVKWGEGTQTEKDRKKEMALMLMEPIGMLSLVVNVLLCVACLVAIENPFKSGVFVAEAFRISVMSSIGVWAIYLILLAY